MMGGIAGELVVKQAPVLAPIEVTLRELARRASGDDLAFRELYDRMKRPLFTYIYRMVGHMGEAEELMQDTMLKIYRNLGRLQGDESFLGWCYAIARNTAISHLRRRKGVTESIEEHGEPADGRRPQEATEVAVDLQRILLEIPPRYRSLFVLGVLEQREYREIAEITGKSLASIKTDIHRARQMVREQWERMRGGMV